MASFQSLEEVNTWESSLISQLDTQNTTFQETIKQLLKDRNPFTGKAASNLGALKLAQQSPDMIYEGIQNIKKQHPKLSEMYTVFEEMIAPEVLDANIKKLDDAVFDLRGVNDYLPIVAQVVQEYIGDIKNLVQTTATIEKNNLNAQIGVFERMKMNEPLFDILIANNKKIGDYGCGLTIPISTILGGLFIEQSENPVKSDIVLQEKGLLSILNTLKGYQQKEVQMIKEIKK